MELGERVAKRFKVDELSQFEKTYNEDLAIFTATVDVNNNLYYLNCLFEQLKLKGSTLSSVALFDLITKYYQHEKHCQHTRNKFCLCTEKQYPHIEACISAKKKICACSSLYLKKWNIMIQEGSPNDMSNRWKYWHPQFCQPTPTIFNEILAKEFDRIDSSNDHLMMLNEMFLGVCESEEPDKLYQLIDSRFKHNANCTLEQCTNECINKWSIFQHGITQENLLFQYQHYHRYFKRITPELFEAIQKKIDDYESSPARNRYLWNLNFIYRQLPVDKSSSREFYTFIRHKYHHFDKCTRKCSDRCKNSRHFSDCMEICSDECLTSNNIYRCELSSPIFDGNLGSWDAKFRYLSEELYLDALERSVKYDNNLLYILNRMYVELKLKGDTKEGGLFELITDNFNSPHPGCKNQKCLKGLNVLDRTFSTTEEYLNFRKELEYWHPKFKQPSRTVYHHLLQKAKSNKKIKNITLYYLNWMYYELRQNNVVIPENQLPQIIDENYVHHKECKMTSGGWICSNHCMDESYPHKSHSGFEISSQYVIEDQKVVVHWKHWHRNFAQVVHQKDIRTKCYKI